ncbi:MAG: tetratricopeptide repeat protein [Actinobacteria bacterium]|nr:tetratricopeptide repeat protein [Actinomycetota bacterium]MBE3122667.1 tetratricopeptide repeat protein [Thermoplasmata archaeon]
MGCDSKNNQPASNELNCSIKRLRDWIQSNNLKELLKERKNGLALTTGLILSIGAGTIAALAIGGPALALSIASWGGIGLANEAIFGTVWDEIKKHIMKSTGKKDITDKEAADYILKIAPDELNAIATAVCNKFKDDPEIKLFLIDIVKNSIESDDFKELLGQVLTEEIKKDMEAQHKEILDEVRKCGIRSFYEILTESQKIDFKSVFKNFRRTIKLTPEELVCVIKNQGTIERTLENEVIKTIDNGKNVLILGMSASGKSVLLMRLCYRLYLEGWKIFFTKEDIDSQKSRELFGRTEGKKLVVIDEAAKHDKYFDLIGNLRSDIRIIMAEQDIVWVNKNRSVKGYNFNELKLELSEREGIDYLDKFGGNKRLLEISNNIFPILTYLVTEGVESLECLYRDVWDVLSPEEQSVSYPIFVLSSVGLDYPLGLFNEIYDSPEIPFIIDGLKNKNIVVVREFTLSSIHPFLSEKILERTTADRFEEINKIFEKINEKKTEERKKYYEFFLDFGHYLTFSGCKIKMKKFYQYAIKSFDICIGINPEDFGIWVNKGTSLSNIGQHTEAVECFDKALEIKPDDALALINKGIALNKMSKYVDAMECLEKALKIKPDDSLAWFNKGIALGETGKYKEALKWLDKILKINPNDDIAMHNKGCYLEEMGKYKEALECYDKALEINPENDKALSSKGLLLCGLRQYEEALACLNDALKINPVNDNALDNKGIILLEMGKYEEALVYLNEALKINPTNSKAMYNKGILLQEVGTYEEALECYDTALKINPKYAKAWYHKAIVHSYKNEKENALKCLSKAIELDKMNKEKAKIDEDFKWLWNNDDFKTLVG